LGWAPNITFGWKADDSDLAPESAGAKVNISRARAPMSPAWVDRCPHVEDLALPKSAENGKLSLNEVVILSMSVKIWHFS
jgi:hypothetical protein